MSFVDDLSDFFNKHKDVEISFQSKRNHTDPQKLSEYILELEGAVRHYSGNSLDHSMGEYRKYKLNSNQHTVDGEKE